uniref:Putative secreted protein n=1 Tax=Anopheles triannulatus TaxID=58253 RepID=A0A2M4B6N4_9DIPT
MLSTPPRSYRRDRVPPVWFLWIGALQRMAHARARLIGDELTSIVLPITTQAASSRQTDNQEEPAPTL